MEQSKIIDTSETYQACSLDPFEDGILLDTSPVCMHRYCRSTIDVEEDCKRQGTTTPSSREAWKRRRKKTELLKLQQPDIRARGRTSGACAAAQQLHQQSAEQASVAGHPAPPHGPGIWHFPRKSGNDVSSEQPKCYFSLDIRPTPRTSGSSRSPGHLAPSPDVRHLRVANRTKGPCNPSSLTPSWP